MQHSIAAKYAARPAARFVRPSRVPASVVSASARCPPSWRRRPSDRAAGRPTWDCCLRCAPRGATSGPLRPAPRRPGRIGPVAAMSRGRARLAGRAPSRGCAGVARLRQATATSAGGIVIRTRRGPATRGGPPSAGRDAVTWTLPKGTPARAARPPRRRRSARSARRRGWRSRSSAGSNRSITPSSSRARGSTRPCTTS